jgi:hypothetical protein
LPLSLAAAATKGGDDGLLYGLVVVDSPIAAAAAAAAAAVATKGDGGGLVGVALPPTSALGEMEQYQGLLEACRSGDESKISSLVQAGASLEKLRTCLGFFPFDVAAERGDEQMAKFFVSEGTHVDVTMRVECQQELTALHLACVGGKTDVARVLIDGGCDVNKGDAGVQQVTPLFRRPLPKARPRGGQTLTPSWRRHRID